LGASQAAGGRAGEQCGLECRRVGGGEHSRKWMCVEAVACSGEVLGLAVVEVVEGLSESGWWVTTG